MTRLYKARIEQSKNIKIFFLLTIIFSFFTAGKVSARTALLPSEQVKWGELIDFPAWNVDLAEIITIFEKANIKLEIPIHYIHPQDYSQYMFFIGSSRLLAIDAIECVAKSLQARYIIRSSNTVEITDGFAWTERLPMQQASRKIILLVNPHYTTDDLLADLRELFSIYTLIENCSIQIIVERAQPILTATFPIALLDRLDQVLQVMSQPGEEIRAPAPDKLDLDTIHLLQKIRQSVLVKYRQVPVETILQDLSIQSDCNIVIANDALNSEFSRIVDLNLGNSEIPLRQALTALAANLGFPGVELLTPDTLVISTEKRSFSPLTSREVVWLGIEVRAYRANELETLYGGSKKMLAEIRRYMDKQIWLDPLNGMIFHRQSGNLIVLAPPRVQHSLQQVLFRMVKDRQMR